MICPYCGKETLESSSTCNHCGRWLLDALKAGPAQTIPQIPASSPDASPEMPVFTAEQVVVPIGGSHPESAVDVDQPAIQPEISSPGQLKPPKDPSKAGMDKWSLCFIGCFILLCLTISCVTVIWLFYSFSSVLDFFKSPTPIPTPSPTPSLLFSDDFSDPNSGWDRVNETDYLSDYYENAYRILVNKDMMDTWANPDDLSFVDVSIEADATKNGGLDDNDFGLICRYQDLDHYYYGIITSDGYYGIIKSSSDGSDALGRDTLGYSDLIHQGFTTNHIRFDCIGDMLTLYVDGVQLDQQTDSEYTSGNVGLTAGTYKKPATDILFDNFKVYQP